MPPPPRACRRWSSAIAAAAPPTRGSAPKPSRSASRSGFEAALNDPFAGGHVIERHAQPGAGIHALQIEIDRRCYLDARLAKPGAGFDRVAALIETLAVELGEALIGRQYATAAE